jgi:ATP-binding cassette subfamily B (MDR/TAP) protein 1
LIKSKENALKPNTFKGVIKFDHVSFAYPKDKKRNILNNLNLEIDCNNSAFVGESGCGKSTILQLIMRFYDPDQGDVYLDDNNLKDIDINWLREHIGYVGQ